jgi:hypothetical protein
MSDFEKLMWLGLPFVALLFVYCIALHIASQSVR